MGRWFSRSFWHAMWCRGKFLFRIFPIPERHIDIVVDLDAVRTLFQMSGYRSIPTIVLHNMESEADHQYSGLYDPDKDTVYLNCEAIVEGVYEGCGQWDETSFQMSCEKILYHELRHALQHRAEKVASRPKRLYPRFRLGGLIALSILVLVWMSVSLFRSPAFHLVDTSIGGFFIGFWKQATVLIGIMLRTTVPLLIYAALTYYLDPIEVDARRYAKRMMAGGRPPLLTIQVS